MAMKHKRQNKFGRVGVLMGGPSAERKISLKSGHAVYDSLKAAGFDVVAIDIKTDNIAGNIRLIKSYGIKHAFIALHGHFGEDGQIQGILDILGISYTGSGVFPSRLAMDKVASRKILQIYGLCVPRYKVLDKLGYNKHWNLHNALSFPLVVKPSTNGSSIGLSIVDKRNGLDQAIRKAFRFDEKVLIEEYIAGREVTVGILNDKALPIIEIVPKNRFFDYEAKYHCGMTDYIVPACLSRDLAKNLQKTALTVHKMLGCFGCSRVDIILDKYNNAYVLELNSIPGLTPTSLLPKAAKTKGIDFTQLCIELLSTAYEKT